MFGFTSRGDLDGAQTGTCLDPVFFFRFAQAISHRDGGGLSDIGVEAGRFERGVDYKRVQVDIQARVFR